MSARQFSTQRLIGEELLAAGWHASSIAVGPGSAWALVDPARCIRLRMSADLAAPLIEVSSAHQVREPWVRAAWQIVVHHAPTPAVLAALRPVPHAAPRATSRDRRAITDAFRASGMRPDRGLLVRVLSGMCAWSSPDRDAEAVWTTPYRTERGGWSIRTRNGEAHLDATPDAPAAVLVPLIMVSAFSRVGAGL